MKLLGEADFGGEVADKDQLAKREIKIVVWFRSRAAIAARMVGQGFDVAAQPVPQVDEDFVPLIRGESDEVAGKALVGQNIDLAEALEEAVAFGRVVPMSENAVDEVDDASVEGAGRFGARQDEIRKHDHRCVLVLVERGCVRRRCVDGT